MEKQFGSEVPASNLKQVPQILPMLCSCPCDSLPIPKLGIFVLKNLSGESDPRAFPSEGSRPWNALPAGGGCTGQSILDYKIRNVQVERFFPKLNYTQTGLY